jgi:hypothetical protein
MVVAGAVAIQVPVTGAVVVARLVQILEVLDHAVHDLNGDSQLVGSRIEP